MKINEETPKKSTFKWAYIIGLFVALALPILTIPPWFFPPDFGKSLVFRSIIAIVLFLFIFQLLFKRNEVRLPVVKKNRIFWAISALFIVFLLATIFSVDPNFSLWGSPYRGGGFITFAFYFIFAVLAFILLKKQDWRRAWDFSIIIGVLVSLVAVAQYYSLFSQILMPAPDRPSSTMGNPILLATYLLLLLFFVISFAIKEKNLPRKIFYIISAALFCYVILITGSRAAYLGITIAAIYFFLFYPKKMKAMKITVVGLLVLMAAFVFYASTVSQYPKFLQHNKLFNSVASRLSVNLLLTDPRFFAWTGIDYKIVLDKPVLGYGPENFSVGFDKFYDPSVPYLNESYGDWWDRAHDIIIQTGSDAGFLGIIAYLSLFIILFWQMRKMKIAHKNNPDSELMPHAIQATLIGYFIANLFGFDSFSTYLIFFFIIGYSLHLASVEAITEPRKIKGGKIIISAALIILIIFLWQYNILPFQINGEINKTNDLVNQKNCNAGLSLMDKTLQEHSFLDSYARLEYGEFIKTCNDFYPENNLTYTKKGLEVISEAAKIQPLYTRYWIFLGSSTGVLAGVEKNPDTKANLINRAKFYFSKALQLSPKHQEIAVAQAKMEIAAGDFASAKNYSEKCISLNPGLGDCYWYLAISEIYMKDNANAQNNIKIASDKLYNITSKVSLLDLSDAYGSLADYNNLVPVYENLILLEPDNAQYHSSLAYFYEQIGQYDKAREQALKVLQLSPESKPNVDAFMKTLP